MSSEQASGPEPPAAGRSGRRRAIPWVDRWIGIAIGIVVGVAAVIVFVFFLGTGGIDAPSLQDDGPRTVEQRTTSP